MKSTHKALIGSMFLLLSILACNIPDASPPLSVNDLAGTSIGAKETKELAVMVDTFYPLSLTKDALEFEKPEYQSTWIEGSGE